MFTSADYDPKDKEAIFTNEEEPNENVIVNSIIKDTLPDDNKYIETSIQYLNNLNKKEKKPKYSQVNTKNNSIRPSNQDLPKTHTNTPGRKRKKKVVFKIRFIEYVDIESYKQLNKEWTHPDYVPDEVKVTEGSKCKECIQKACIIL